MGYKIMNNQNNLLIPKSLKQNLIDHSDDIDILINKIHSLFQEKILLHFQIFNCEGFEFPINNKFVATNSVPKELENMLSSYENYILLRFFCNVNTFFSKNNHLEFCENLNQKFNNPVFFMTPYIDSYDVEQSFIIEPKFEIKIYITTSSIKIYYINYSEDLKIFNKVKLELSPIFSEKKSIDNFNLNRSNKKIKLDKNLKNIIKNAKNHMIKGDCYLANITSTEVFSKDTNFISANDFFKSWLSIFSRFGIFYKDTKKGIASFSPERFLLRQNNTILTEPIKGTLKSKSLYPTQMDANEIWANKKEIYEHTLVIDLMRNDLYQVCIPEKVTVYKPFFARISGSFIQMQSFLIGKMKTGINLSDCLKQMLPAGSITGTPKKRVCEIIANLESTKRGYYTGICGILEQNGDFDTTILIRSIYMGERGIYFGVGAGITSLSDINSEFEECEQKLNSILPVFERNFNDSFC